MEDAFGWGAGVRGDEGLDTTYLKVGQEVQKQGRVSTR
jgi:hypothetical protein